MQYVLDDNGIPQLEPDLYTWARWFRDAERHVALDNIGDVRVSTVFLGIDHSFNGGYPVLYETMIFGGEYNEYQERYHTKEEAIAGHAHAVSLAKGEHGTT